uniref:Uncharacterized protein LOC111102634 n=1 Tax=Crassostrea virginica TaxID=6565 RepID=A0A8B8AI20_CRAVI|nr:uncharacterized protein LOC111102634 [Crassostrea virginica]
MNSEQTGFDDKLTNNGFSSLTETEFIETLKTRKKKEITECFKELEKKGKSDEDFFHKLNRKVEKEFKGETLLHIALMYEKTAELCKTIIRLMPDVLVKDRKNYPDFKGQTPLHFAIVKGNLENVENILLAAKENKTIETLLGKSATGKKFRKTFLMGQLPLSVAAPACEDEDFDILKKLIDYGAVIEKKNDSEDSVFHSLIKYAKISPDKVLNIVATFDFLWKKYSKLEKAKSREICFWENKSGLTPLHLSVKLGVSQLFDYIVNIQDAYCFKNLQEGILDVREYDVTEFDRLIPYLESSEIEEKSSAKNNLTILESLLESKCTKQEAFAILSQEVVTYILKKKWLAYKNTLKFWGLIHLFFLVQFTASTIYKAEVLFCPQNACNQTMNDLNDIYYAIIFINMLFGIIYLIFFGLCITKLVERRRYRSGSYNHNLSYILSLLVISVGAMVESFLILLQMHLDYHLFFALSCGWYFMFYFFPFSKPLVSFTSMVKTGLMEDFYPFCVVFICLLGLFTGVMHMLFLGTEKVDGFDSFQNSFLTMFNLGVGMGNVEVLNKARIPWVAYIIFVLFVVVAYIHLFTALIAVMSHTFAGVNNSKDFYQKYNKLRMIELFEDIVLVRGVANYLPCVKKAKHWRRSEDYNCNDGEYEKRRFYSVVQYDDQNDNLNEEEE